MRINYKLGIVGIIAALLVAFAAFGSAGTAVRAEVTGSAAGSGPTAVANTNGVWTVSEQGIDPAVGVTTAQEDCAKGVNTAPSNSGANGAAILAGSLTGKALPINTTIYPNVSNPSAPFGLLSTLPTLLMPTSGSQILCVNADDGDGDLSFDARDSVGNIIGAFTKPSCSLSTVSNGTPIDGDARVAEWPDDACQAPTGVNTGHLIVPDGPLTCQNNVQTVCNNDLDVVMVVFTCPSSGNTILVTIGQDQSQVQFQIICSGQPGGITLTATPTTVEIVPAASNTAHSLIQVVVTDAAGNPVLVNPGTEVDFTVNQGLLSGATPLGGCAIETAPFTVSSASSPTGLINDVTGVSSSSVQFNLNAARQLLFGLTTAQPLTYLAWDDFANEGPAGGTITEQSLFFPDLTPTVDQTTTFDVEQPATIVRSMAAAILHCDVHPGVTNPVPGVVTVQACIDVVGSADICKTVTVTVIGPPASITVAASPTSVRCGEKSTITVTVKDSIGQNVSDHTVVELVTNLGGTIGGTGAVAGFGSPVAPISSSVAGTFGGVATAFLLTSEVTTGPYEVVATSGGTEPQNFLRSADGTDFSNFGVRQTILGGIFSTAPVSAQVTVTCSLPSPTAAPAATVTAPRTGTGINPPNTGDAGLKDTSSSWALFAIGGLAAFALAGLASLKFARR